MQNVRVETKDGFLTLTFTGEISIHNLQSIIDFTKKLDFESYTGKTIFDFKDLTSVDTASAIYINKLLKKYDIKLKAPNKQIVKMLELTKENSDKSFEYKPDKLDFLQKTGLYTYKKFAFVISVLNFLGELFVRKVKLLNIKNFRTKELLYEINQTGLKAVGIIALTSFLVGIVIAYQAAVQLKIYGANIFIVDMIGISVLREMAPMITAIVIAGRSGSSFTAEIGAMKITDELDAMRSMGFDPYYFMIIPKILALIIVLPILIFIADMFGILGGAIISKTELDLSFMFFIDRFNEVIAFKHFFIGIFKGPFFAFLIAVIAIYRGLNVKDDTQSIGKNTTKSVVESIFAVIVCDALFSVVFTNLGI